MVPAKGIAGDVMAYNISEVSDTFTDGLDTWTTTADLNDPSVDIISGALIWTAMQVDRKGM